MTAAGAIYAVEHHRSRLDQVHSRAAAFARKISSHAAVDIEPAAGNDAPQFKGIFARNLAALNSAAPVPGFRAFFRRNAESIWKNRDAEGRRGLVWPGPVDIKTAATPVSALDA